VVYLYLDKLSIAFAGWGRSKDQGHPPDEQDSIKQAAE
jgi:HAE1 family hydrophobic/amphiphilic exporter-1